MVFDVFSKYGWIVPLNTKTAKVANVFRKLSLANAAHRRLATEFHNQLLKSVLTANIVTLYSTENEEKPRVVGQDDEDYNVEIL